MKLFRNLHYKNGIKPIHILFKFVRGGVYVDKLHSIIGGEMVQSTGKSRMYFSVRHRFIFSIGLIMHDYCGLCY